MPTKQKVELVNWDAVLEELEGYRAELESAIKAVKRIKALGVNFGHVSTAKTVIPLGQSSLETATSSAPINAGGDEIRSDAFFKMTIADAAVKYLRKWANCRPQSTRDIIRALDKGGIRGKGYQTVYKLLQRRQKDKGDVVNVHGDWGLQEWYSSEPPAPIIAQ